MQVRHLSTFHGKFGTTYNWSAPNANTIWNRFNGNIDGFVEGTKRMMENNFISSHTVNPIEVEVNGSRAITVSTANVAIRATFAGIEYEIESFVQFHNRLEHVALKSGHEWRLVHFEAVYDRDYIFPTCPIIGQQPIIEIAPDARSCFKYLEWYLNQQGHKLAQDLPGTDKPDTVAKLLDENQRWLRKE